jgi:hopanoid biosynthesis associated protein HpnK
VNEEGCEEAVRLARENPRLGIGLHLTLLCGRSALPPKLIPGLVNGEGQFSSGPAATGFRYFSRKSLYKQLEAEIAAQVRKFHATGLKLDHLDGHLHLHLHPTVFKIVMANAERWGIRHVRWSRDPFWINARLARGRWGYRVAHAFIFAALSRRARPALRARQIKHTNLVFGILQDGHVDEKFVLGLLPALPAGDSELYSHPCPGQFKHELEALVSPAVKALLSQLRIELIRYQDL